MTQGSAAWDGLSPAWRVTVSEAWTSWVAGSAGVGAALVDDLDVVVATGRNRMMERGPGRLSGTMMAHAEMDLLSQVPFGTQAGGALYTTFEPCLMCAATILLYRVPEVHYAAADPVFDGLHDWIGTHPFTADRVPVRVHLGGPIGAFCHVLHLAWLAANDPPDDVIEAHRRLSPGHLECATDVVRWRRLRALADDGGSAADAVDALWADLVALGG
jgi:tRNA(Arg) A34 adenosine deaminase TadA